ncbi:hypothetical protein Sjap_018358 [Stephania japonica]|uniref:Methyltransferase type 11 domain-containing protein n=1 Tax=Stephania japonica TaxID=461633 RepID=A0AAP0I821_9MAGN
MRAYASSRDSKQDWMEVAEFCDQVIATDVSEAQVSLSMSDDELVAMFGCEGMVDLVTVATAAHWFDLPRFYSVVKRLLKPSGIITVWSYMFFTIDNPTPSLELTMKQVFETTLPYWNNGIRFVLDDYKTLPFSFESVGLGSEGEPLMLEMK